MTRFEHSVSAPGRKKSAGSPYGFRATSSLGAGPKSGRLAVWGCRLWQPHTRMLSKAPISVTSSLRDLSTLWSPRQSGAASVPTLYFRIPVIRPESDPSTEAATLPLSLCYLLTPSIRLSLSSESAPSVSIGVRSCSFRAPSPAACCLVR